MAENYSPSLAPWQESGGAVHRDSASLAVRDPKGNNDVRNFFGANQVPVASWPEETPTNRVADGESPGRGFE